MSSLLLPALLVFYQFTALLPSFPAPPLQTCAAGHRWAPLCQSTPALLVFYQFTALLPSFPAPPLQTCAAGHRWAPPGAPPPPPAAHSAPSAQGSRRTDRREREGGGIGEGTNAAGTAAVKLHAHCPLPPQAPSLTTCLLPEGPCSVTVASRPLPTQCPPRLHGCLVQALLAGMGGCGTRALRRPERQALGAAALDQPAGGRAGLLGLGFEHCTILWAAK